MINKVISSPLVIWRSYICEWFISSTLLTFRQLSEEIIKLVLAAKATQDLYSRHAPRRNASQVQYLPMLCSVAATLLSTKTYLIFSEGCPFWQKCMFESVKCQFGMNNNVLSTIKNFVTFGDSPKKKNNANERSKRYMSITNTAQQLLSVGVLYGKSNIQFADKLVTQSKSSHTRNISVDMLFSLFLLFSLIPIWLIWIFLYIITLAVFVQFTLRVISLWSIEWNNKWIKWITHSRSSWICIRFIIFTSRKFKSNNSTKLNFICDLLRVFHSIYVKDFFFLCNQTMCGETFKCNLWNSCI